MEEPLAKTCPTCGVVFSHGRSDRVYCSAKCRHSHQGRRDYQSARRASARRTMMRLLGSKCSICGYDDCMDALDFHHRNPEEKEFKLGGGSMLRNLEELEKCDLLCARCHREVHSGFYRSPASSEGR